MSNSNRQQSRWGAPPAAAADNREEERDSRRRANIRGYEQDAPSMNNNQRGDSARGADDSSRRGYPIQDDLRNSSSRGGSGGDYYYGRGRGEDDHHYEGGGSRTDWRCMECGLDNYPKDECCPRCRTWRGDDERDGRSSRDSRRYDEEDDDRYYDRNYPGSRRSEEGYYGRENGRGGRWDDLHDFASRGRSRSHGHDDYYDEEDAFGRRSRPRSKSRDEPKKKTMEWPPQFESAGASFIFDARSGMFYEPHSDFFYDPKTKFYYSNKKQQYFRYEADKKPHMFQPVGGEGGNGTHTQGQTAGETAEGGSSTSVGGQPAVEAQAKPAEKPKIAISIKTPVPQANTTSKSLSDVAAEEKARLTENSIKRKQSALSAAGDSTTPSTVSQPHKKHAKDLDMWSGRQDEMRDEDTQSPAAKKIKTTASGQPICDLCRRKFATIEKLQQHEKLSQLHKDNLAKKKKEDEEKQAYRDRTKERREMHGPHTAPESSSSHAEALLAHSLGTGAVKKYTPAEIIRPAETLNNETNVGNKLLQKMGWKGEALGSGKTSGSVAASNLKSDWERIENLAASRR